MSYVSDPNLAFAREREAAGMPDAEERLTMRPPSAPPFTSAFKMVGLPVIELPERALWVVAVGQHNGLDRYVVAGLGALGEPGALSVGLGVDALLPPREYAAALLIAVDEANTQLNSARKRASGRNPAAERR